MSTHCVSLFKPCPVPGTAQQADIILSHQVGRPTATNGQSNLESPQMLQWYQRFLLSNPRSNRALKRLPNLKSSDSLRPKAGLKGLTILMRASFQPSQRVQTSRASPSRRL